jgi:hypothetical protein
VRRRPQTATYVGCEVAVRLYLVPHLGETKLTALKTADVRGMLNRIRQQCQCCAQGVAVAEEVLTRNVASFAKPTRPRRHRFQTWSVAEATTFLATIREHRFMHYSRSPSCSACAGRGTRTALEGRRPARRNHHDGDAAATSGRRTPARRDKDR